MTAYDEVLVFLEALDRLVGRITSDQKPDNRYAVDMLDLVEAERLRIRALSEPQWPDTLWHDYRLSLVVVERSLGAVFERFPERSEVAEKRAIEVCRWLVQLTGDIKRAVRTDRVQ